MGINRGGENLKWVKIANVIFSPLQHGFPELPIWFSVPRFLQRSFVNISEIINLRLHTGAARVYAPGWYDNVFFRDRLFLSRGTETQRIGIVPDIEIKPTVQGIRQGKDELLDRAIQLIENDE
jgi:hypothetical protein